MRRRFAIAARVGASVLMLGAVGCSALANLDGLSGGECGSACIDAAPPEAEEAAAPAPTGTVTSLADSGKGPIDASGGASRADAGAAPLDLQDSAPPLDDAGVAIDTGEPQPTFVDAAPCTPATPPSLDLCAVVGAMDAPPVIDGVLDCGIPLWPMPVIVSSGPGVIPSTVQASIAAAWRPDGLYLFVAVTGAGGTRTPAPAGDPAWCGDAIELFVDHAGVFPSAPAYSNPGTIQLVTVSPATGSPPTSVGEMFRNEADLGAWKGQFVSEATSDGFTTEAFVTASDLGLTSWSLAAGGKIGLDVAIDLGSPAEPATCPRLGQFTIQIPVGTNGGCAAACDVREFCTPALE